MERRLRQWKSTTGLTIVGTRTGGGDGGRSAAAHCIAARHKARASRGDRAPPDGFVASSRPSRALRGRPIHPPIHGEASRPDRRRPGGRWLCLGWRRGRRWAAMHTHSTRAFVTRNPGRTRGLALHRTAHEHKDRCRQAEAMLEAMCIFASAEPHDTAAAIPRRPARSQHGHSVTGPHGHRQRAEQAATARAHHGIDHRHLARGGHP